MVPRDRDGALLENSFACWHIAEGRNPKRFSANWDTRRSRSRSTSTAPFKRHDTETADALADGSLATPLATAGGGSTQGPDQALLPKSSRSTRKIGG